MALDLTHQTAAQFVARFRQTYRRASFIRAARMAHWLYDRYQAGDVTVAQIRTAFGLTTDPEWIAFRDRVLALRNAWQAVKEARGE